MTRWGFCDGLGVYDVLGRRCLRLFLVAFSSVTVLYPIKYIYTPCPSNPTTPLFPFLLLNDRYKYFYPPIIPILPYHYG